MCCCLWGKKREAARVRHSRTTNDDSRGHNVDLESGPHSRVSLPDAVHFRESKTPLPGTADVEISEKADVEPPSYKAVMAQRVDAPVEPVRQPLGPDVGQHDESRRSSSASISDNISEVGTLSDVESIGSASKP